MSSFSSSGIEENLLSPVIILNHSQLLHDYIDRCHTQQYLIKHYWGNLFSAPIDSALKVGGNLRILNLRCGPGTWICEMATTYRTSNFLGVDDLNNFPKEIKPINSKFLHRSIFGEQISKFIDHFDYIHIPFIQHSSQLSKRSWNDNDDNLNNCNNLIYNSNDNRGDDDIFMHNFMIDGGDNDILKILKNGGWLEISSWNMDLDRVGPVTKKLTETCM